MDLNLKHRNDVTDHGGGGKGQETPQNTLVACAFLCLPSVMEHNVLVVHPCCHTWDVSFLSSK